MVNYTDVRRGESVSDIETKLVMATQAKWFDILVVELHAIPVCPIHIGEV